MQQGPQNKLIRLIALFLVAVTAMLIVNRALFLHTHISPNGEVFVHSHPFQKGNQKDVPTAAHHHTAAQCHFLDSLNLLFPILFFVISQLHLFVKQDYYISDHTIFVASFLVVRQGRDPPFLLV